MMVSAVNPEVEKLVEDAEDLLNKAIGEVDVNIRDAAEKAWGATVRATDALILDRRGFVPTGPTAMPDRRRALHEIYGKEPLDEVKRRILETRDFIEDVKKLTEHPFTSSGGSWTS
ncbi:MAG: hypothetical protein QW231_03500 [Candidatus Bathyarchaeia archaeon]